MASLIYALCAVFSLGIAVLLWAHYRRTRSRLLYWSALCFSGLTVNNLLLVLDKLALPDHDLSLVRQGTALASLLLLLYGLVWEDE
jgi:hypothetical protein